MKGECVVNALYKAMSENPDKKILELFDIARKFPAPCFSVTFDNARRFVSMLDRGLELPILNIRTKRDNILFPDYIPAWSLHRLLCLYEQGYTIKELYNNAEECYGMLISAIEIAIENDEFNKEYLKQ